MAKLTLDDIKAITDAGIRNCASANGILSREREKALDYFHGRAIGDLAPPEVEGRSTFVDTTVRSTILWMKPTLIKTFCGSDNVVEFTPTSEDDEDKAKLATEYINHIFYKQNPGFAIVNTWFDDALLQKVGVVKVWWDDRQEQSREEYKALDDVALAQLLDDPEVEPIEQTSYQDADAAKQKQSILEQMTVQMQAATQAAQQGDQRAAQALPQMQAQYNELFREEVPMLYDVTFKRTKKAGRVRIENVPPEEFDVNKGAKSVREATFVRHRVRRTISDLKAAGYKNVDEIGSAETDELSGEAIARDIYDDHQPLEELTNDKSMREVWLNECYLRADWNGDGIAEWIKVCRAGDQVLEIEECDGPPFVTICPIPLAHKLYGLSIADLGMEPQRQSTNIVRSQLDNMYLQVNGRHFAVEGQVNLDDLLSSRPGGVVRVKAPGAVGRLDQAAGDLGAAQMMGEWMQSFTENSTGWTAYSQGGNSDSLNDTATGVNIITNKADARIELVSRTFAETGFTDLFKLILKLVGQHQDKAVSLKLGRKWVQIDPREWRNQFDLSINVGLGTGNKDQQVGHLNMLMQQQTLGLQLGIAKPKNVFAAAKKLTEALGFKDADAYWTDPTAPPDPNEPAPPPPPPDPAMLKLQADQQMSAQKMQFDQQQAERDAAIKQEESRAKAEMEQFKAQLSVESAERIAQINGEYMLKAKEMDHQLHMGEITTQAHVQLAEAGATAEGIFAPLVQQVHAETFDPIMQIISELDAKIDRSNRMQTHLVKNPDGTKYTVKVDPSEQSPS